MRVGRMDISDKRTERQALDAVALGNRRWWTGHTMSYDWNDPVAAEKFSAAWFDEIDSRFIDAARLFAHDRIPFDRIIPFERLINRSVLEIGCGMGLHSELMVKAGAHVTAIDVSDTSVEAMRRRAALKGFAIDVLQGDAATTDFPSESFDFIWSWGVIHHASYTGRIVKEIHRLLKPGGQARCMVYNLEGAPAYATFVRKHLFGFWRGHSLDRVLWADTDGYSARYYTPDTLADLFNTFFEKTSVEVYGQEADAIPLPRVLRKLVRPLFSDTYLKRKVRERGGFLFITADKS
jgi:2-polyprenyl-3-methyl-5-hydroxy-6-metoxy-1,4-benzoquinol methylase